MLLSMSTNRVKFHIAAALLCGGFVALTLPGWSAAEELYPQSTDADPHAHHQHAHHAHHAPSENAGYVRSEHLYAIPDVTLVNTQGQKVSLASTLATDGPVLLNFIFTSCTAICPVLSATFSQTQEALVTERVKPQMVSITIDPEYDTLTRLREYAARYRAKPQWQFLTGSPDDIVTVQKAFDSYRGNKMNHAPLTFLRASSETTWVRLEGFASAADLLDEYHRITAR